MRKLVILIASGLGTGFSPKAPGTAGSLLGVGIFILLRGFSFPVQLTVTILVSLVGFWAAHQAEKVWGQKDCQKIVIDEVAGQMVAGLFLVGNFPYGLSVVLLFLLFRLYDIQKPFPTRWLQDNLPGGFGVMGDDLMAGVQAGLTYRVLLYFLHHT